MMVTSSAGTRSVLILSKGTPHALNVAVLLATNVQTTRAIARSRHWTVSTNNVLNFLILIRNFKVLLVPTVRCLLRTGSRAVYALVTWEDRCIESMWVPF